MDSDYLKKHVGEALAAALASAALSRPEDPVLYVGEYLLKHVDNEHYRAALIEEELKREKEREEEEQRQVAAREEEANRKRMKELSIEKIRVAQSPEGLYEAAIACIEEHTSVTSAYIAAVEDDEEEGAEGEKKEEGEKEEGQGEGEGEGQEGEKGEQAEKEIPLKPVSANAVLRYVEADKNNSFLLGQTLSRAQGPVSFSALDVDAPVLVSNVLTHLPCIHYFRREKPGSFACFPIRDSKREAQALLATDTLGFDSKPLSEEDFEYLKLIAAEVACQLSAIQARAEEAAKELSDSYGEELQGSEATEEDDVAALEEKAKKNSGQLALIRSQIEQKLDADKISEIKRSKAATKTVHKVMAAAIFVVKLNKTSKVPKEIDSDWSLLRQHIGDSTEFIKAVLAYDPAGKRFKKAFVLAKKAIKGLTGEKANKASIAAGLLFQWVKTCIDVSDKAVAIRKKKQDAGEEVAPESDDEGEEGEKAEEGGAAE